MIRHSLVLAAVVLGVFAATPTTAAQGDTWVLALSWQPQFCQNRPEKPECGRIKPGAYGAANLVLHGLWPRENYCGVEARQRALDEDGKWHRLPELTLSPGLAAELKDVMPGVHSHLDRHQWLKHGTCSSLGQEEYFRLAVDLARQASAMRFDDLIASRAGGALTRDELCAAFSADFGARYANAVKLALSDGGLQEIHIRLRVENGKTALTGDNLADGPPLRCGDRKIAVDAAD